MAPHQRRRHENRLGRHRIERAVAHGQPGVDGQSGLFPARPAVLRDVDAVGGGAPGHRALLVRVDQLQRRKRLVGAVLEQRLEARQQLRLRLGAQREVDDLGPQEVGHDVARPPGRLRRKRQSDRLPGARAVGGEVELAPASGEEEAARAQRHRIEVVVGRHHRGAVPAPAGILAVQDAGSGAPVEVAPSEEHLAEVVRSARKGPGPPRVARGEDALLRPGHRGEDHAALREDAGDDAVVAVRPEQRQPRPLVAHRDRLHAALDGRGRQHAVARAGGQREEEEGPHAGKDTCPKSIAHLGQRAFSFCQRARSCAVSLSTCSAACTACGVGALSVACSRS